MAIDINPLYNPYVWYSKKDGHQIVEPATGKPYVDRKADFPYKITTSVLLKLLLFSSTNVSVIPSRVACDARQYPA